MNQPNDASIADIALGYGVTEEGYVTPPVTGDDEQWALRNIVYSRALVRSISELERDLYPILTAEQRAVAECVERRILAKAANYMTAWGYSIDGTGDAI